MKSSRIVGNRGFTLVELLVVIGIIAVLVGMIFPVVRSARNAATNVRCQTNLREVANAYRMYGQTFKDQAPLGFFNNTLQDNYTAYSGTARRELFPMMLVNARLLKMPEILFCPAESNESYTFKSRTNPWPPVAGSQTTVNIGYGTRPMVNWPSNLAWPTQSFPRLSKLGRKAIMSDLTITTASLSTRHRKGINVSYADGSVDFMPQKLFATQLNVAGASSGAPSTTVINVGNSVPSPLWAELDKAY